MLIILCVLFIHSDLPLFIDIDTCSYSYGLKFSLQARIGSGWFVEPYNGSDSRTLVTYIGNVSEWNH